MLPIPGTTQEQIMFNGKLVHLALPLITYIAAAGAGVGFAAYQETRKRKQHQAADAFRSGENPGGDHSVAADNLPSGDGIEPAPQSRTYPFNAVG
ncbi:hypothetical protein [Cupriavidus sp. U2]|uniref:hypothetical protein n=1 Tax=Cupriavidus sp. U2 TaxID=2920269 RepID=UPI00129DD3EB|nr:hypothetical protein [Cupriavidus sp. U2]